MRRPQKAIVAAIALLMTLSGCATNLKPHEFPEGVVNSAAKAKTHYSDQWDEPAIVREGSPLVVLQRPMDVPGHLLERQISLRLEQGANVRDLVAVLANLGVSIMLTDKSAGDREFYMPRYEGTLGGLLSALTKAADVWFTWEDGIINVSGTAKISVSVPQDETLASVVEKQLGELLKEPRNLSSATSTVSDTDAALSISHQAGMANFVVSPSQYARLQTYLQRIARNAAVVTLQVAVVSVALKQDSSAGIDWSSVQFAIGSHSDGYRSWLQSGMQNAQTEGQAQPGTTADGTDGSSAGPGPGADPGKGVYFNGSNLRGIMTSRLFSLAGFYNFLQDYGTTTVMQNLLLKTVTGNEVKLESVTEIPYVSEVGVTTSNTTNTNLSALGSAQTDKAKDGVTISLTPSYDEASNMVTVSMELSIDQVIAFNELSAGAQLGTLTQPTTAKRQFTDILRMRPGTTAVVGGLTYDSISNNASGPIGLERSPLEYKSIKSERQTMFVVIRPTVAVLGVPEAEDAPSIAPAVKAPAQDVKPTSEMVPAKAEIEPSEPGAPSGSETKSAAAVIETEPMKPTADDEERAALKAEIDRLAQELAAERERASASVTPVPVEDKPAGPAAPEGYRQLSL